MHNSSDDELITVMVLVIVWVNRDLLPINVFTSGRSEVRGNITD